MLFVMKENEALNPVHRTVIRAEKVTSAIGAKNRVFPL
jgi:hypothetical protein